MKTCTVYWMSPTGAAGHAKPMSQELAEAWARHGNKEFPTILHWVGMNPEDEGPSA